MNSRGVRGRGESTPQFFPQVRERWARGGGDVVGICAVRKDTTGGSQTGRTSGAKMFEDPLAAMHAAQGFTAMMD